MTSPTSLRDLYAAPSNVWTFAPPTMGTNSTSPSLPSSTPSSYQWSTRPSQNPLFDLSTSLSDDTSIDMTVIVKGLLASALLHYSTTALVMPWDVGKMLLQVQWVPRDIGDIPPGAVLTTDAYEEDEAELSDSSGADDSYFADPTNPENAESSHPTTRQLDDRGYVVRGSVLEEGLIPEYVIPVGSADGTWGMMKRLGRFRPEGWLALWKGLLTSAITDAVSINLQPAILSLLRSFFPSSSPFSSFSQPPLLLPVASHVVAGFLISPLDLVRTRLIIQSSLPRYRTYSGPIDALHQILEQEGGLKGIYLHPHLLIPTLLDCTLRSLVPLVLPGLLASYMSFGGVQITAETHPITWSMAEFVGSCLGLLITLPFETVRRRLQAQVRGTALPLKSCVELRPAPYNGVVDTFWHILTEERSDLPLVPHKRKRRASTKEKGKAKASEPDEQEEQGSWFQHTGIGQLYRGLGMRLGASAVVFVLATISGDEPDSGWAEL